ncbi:MBL fold metallo-hydrolase [Rossellomorea aquimaris]|uniref:MBL fold metallo-hydrolase n=1 Tax=Rossellomorea aquimaris TaxID=189382 RepID=A0A5D4UHS5_9BACI|nr:MBL fold metallo-hydrolase [Rossellomorea aquimaris]TYS77631.1 MBL fold metallo-hydrolase [Rossellomorea aquimaris]TYS86813.1 MBL fold metallo-hydrolase [Rossellomorea aquimaris]
MQWKQIPLGPLQTNCYILWNTKNECLVVDPGGEGEKLIQWLENHSLTPLAILLTHAHFDHIGAVDQVRDNYSIPAYIHEKEAKWLLDPALNGSQLFMMGDLIRLKPADYILTNEKHLTIGDFQLELFETPGHSPGSISYYVQESGIVLAGDTLFMGSIGRSDLPGGNHKELLASIHEKLLTLPETTTVLAGHGPETSIEGEMDSNPFLNGF